jgi:hypothetical protein
LNIVVDPFGNVHIVDWDSLQERGQEKRRGQTPGFVSPFAPKQVSPQDDLFALGVTLEGGGRLDCLIPPAPKNHVDVFLKNQRLKLIGYLKSKEAAAEQALGHAFLTHPLSSHVGVRRIMDRILHTPANVLGDDSGIDYTDSIFATARALTGGSEPETATDIFASAKRVLQRRQKH